LAEIKEGGGEARFDMDLTSSSTTIVTSVIVEEA